MGRKSTDSTDRLRGLFAGRHSALRKRESFCKMPNDWRLYVARVSNILYMCVCDFGWERLSLRTQNFHLKNIFIAICRLNCLEKACEENIENILRMRIKLPNNFSHLLFTYLPL